jgi:SNF2 family DNA or RNA helicase
MLINKFKLPAFQEKMKGYQHQDNALAASKNASRFALFMEQGTGKSKVTIDNFVQLFLEQQIDGVLITAPKAFYLNWFVDELPAHLPDWLPVRIHYWDADWTIKERKEASNILQAKDDVLDIFLVNIEALATDRGIAFAEKFVKQHYTFMVIDESTCIKNHKAKRTKAAIELGRLCDYRRILTGTPMAKGPLDIYAQAEFLQKGLSGHSNFLSFKNYYANWRRVEFGNRSYEKIDNYKNIPELQQKVASFSVRVLKSECLDLPDKTFVNRYIEQTPEQKLMYTELKEEAMTFLSKESVVSSTSVLTTMMKLHQVNCGHVKDDDGIIHHIPNNRVATLMETIEVIDGKVIIWAHFQQDIRNIMAALIEEYGINSAVSYYGLTSIDDRKTNLERFKTDPKCRFFVSNETGSKSLTLIQSALSIYYSYSYSLETWLQSQDRNHRIGQTRNVLYISFVIRKTVDETIMKALRAKKNIADQVLDNWRENLY